MRFMSLVRSVEGFPAGPPPASLFEAMAKLGEEGTKAGVLVDMGGLQPTAAGMRFRIADGKLTVTDGPFTEAKEMVGGYAILEAKTREEAVYWTQRFMELHMRHWPEWEGECELRPYQEGPPA